MPVTPRPRSSRGFTLVELLISLAVMTIVILAALMIFDFNSRLARVQTQVSDMQQALRAGEGCHQRGRVVEVRAAHLHALRGQVGQRLGLAGGGDDLPGRHPVGLQQVGDDAAAELAGRAGHEQGGSGHEETPGVGWGT